MMTLSPIRVSAWPMRPPPMSRLKGSRAPNAVATKSSSPVVSDEMIHGVTIPYPSGAVLRVVFSFVTVVSLFRIGVYVSTVESN